MTPEIPEFDSLVTAWPKRWLEKPRRLLPQALEGSRPGGWWADLGCGEGVFTAVLAQLAPEARGIAAIDLDGDSLLRLRTNFDRAGLVEKALYPVQADLRCLPLEGVFEGLLAANALHFLKPTEQERWFQGCRRLLRSGGRLIVVEYDAERGTGAVPYPLSAEGFIATAKQAGFGHVSIAARVPSSYLGEMYAGTADSE